MYSKLVDMALRVPVRDAGPKPAEVGGVKVKKINARPLSYHHRSRGQWIRPEYDFDEIQIAQATDSYLMRAIAKKVNRVIVAGWNFTSDNEEALKYIKRRVRYNEFASQRAFDQQVIDTVYDVVRFNNCMWVKVRGKGIPGARSRTTFGNVQLDPVAGIFVLPMETLEFKSKRNGELISVQQKMPDGTTKVFPRHDLVHFYSNRNPGFAVGTPELLPALDDIAVLRRLEENIEELVESNLFPVYHWKVGSDTFPERFGKDGVKETDRVKQTLEYLTAGSVYVSDHRHEIQAIGSEGRALRIEAYVEHFKRRVFAAIGVSAVDLGEGDSANRSTASTMSKGMLMDVEAVTRTVERFIEQEFIVELLIEGGFDPFDETQMVRFKFGTIDKDDRRADENQQIQLFHGNLRTIDEVRQALGDRPFEDADLERTHFKMYEEPLALLKGMGPGTAAAETLAGHASSNVDQAAVNKEKQFVEKQAKEANKAKAAGSRNNTATGRPGGSKSQAASRSSANKARPANQTGKRASAKTTKDYTFSSGLDDGEAFVITCDLNLDDDKVAAWASTVIQTWIELGDAEIALQTVADTQKWRLE